MRDADHGGLAHRRVGQQRVLDLAGADPVAAALDQVGGGAARRCGASRRGPIGAMSPVRNQPSSVTGAVASGRLR